MERALSRILYGMVFIFLDIRIGVDLLADPIGYLLIAVGCLKLSEKYADGKSASIFSTILIFLSIPSVFIDFNLIQSGAWHYFSNFVFAGEVVLTFYLFRMLREIAEKAVRKDLADRTRRLFNLYIPLSLLMLAMGAVGMVSGSDYFRMLLIALVILLLILNIAFIILLAAFRKMARKKIPSSVFGSQEG